MQVLLHRALQGAGAVDRVIADSGQPVPGVVGQLQPNLAVFQQACDAVDLDVHNRAHMFECQPVEQDDLIEPVEEFRAEMAAHNLHHLRLHHLNVLIIAQAGNELRAEI